MFFLVWGICGQEAPLAFIALSTASFQRYLLQRAVGPNLSRQSLLGQFIPRSSHIFGGRKLFCLGSPLHHKIYAFLAKIRVSSCETVVNLVYAFWNIRGTSAAKDWSKCNIIISNTIWLWGSYEEAEKKGCSCSGWGNVNFSFTLSFV